MPTKIFIDTDANAIVGGFNSVAPIDPSSFFRGDVLDAELYFLTRTGINGQPYASKNTDSATCKLGIGDKLGTPTSGTWTLDGNSLGYDATAAQIQTALRTSQSDNALTVTGSMADGFTVTWGANGAEALLSGDASGLLPECDLTIGERRAGTGSVKEQQFIRVRLKPAAYQDSWSNLSTSVTATVSTVAGGSSTVSEVQKIAFNRSPISGSFTITVPSDTRSVTAAVVAGVFTTTANHGLAINEPVTFTSFTNEANFTEGTRYYVKAIPTPTTFTISATSGGAAITNATADAGSGQVITTARTTTSLPYDATAAQVQAALQALDCIGAGNVSVTGVPGESYQIAFQSAKQLANFPAVTVDASGLVGAYGKAAQVSLATFQMADFLGDDPARRLALEIQLVESGTTTTAVSQDVTITADLIDWATLSPIPAPSNVLFSRKTSDQQFASTTLSDVAGMSIQLAANAVYQVSFVIIAEAQSGIDLDAIVVAPSGSSVFGKWVVGRDLATNGVFSPSEINATTRATILIDSDENEFAIPQSFLVITTNAGELKIQAAKNTSGGSDSKIKAGSFIGALRVA